jgi:YD repeat-containing protein
LAITSSVYDHANRLTQTINANHQCFTFVYDAANRKIQETDPSMGVRNTGSDPVGNVTYTSDPQPSSATMVFDPINRMTQGTYANTTSTVVHAYTYDKVGNRLSDSSPAGTYTYSWDARNQKTLVNEPGGKTATYGFDKANRRTAMSAYDQGNLTYAFDQANRQVQVVNTKDGVTTLVYDPVGQKIQLQLSNGALVTQSFDPVGNMTGIAQKMPGGTLISLQGYAYDAVNNRTAGSDFDGTTTTLATWTYDKVHQMTGEHVTGAANFQHTHTSDGVRNRILLETDS